MAFLCCCMEEGMSGVVAWRRERYLCCCMEEGMSGVVAWSRERYLCCCMEEGMSGVVAWSRERYLCCCMEEGMSGVVAWRREWVEEGEACYILMILYPDDTVLQVACNCAVQLQKCHADQTGGDQAS